MHILWVQPYLYGNYPMKYKGNIEYKPFQDLTLESNIFLLFYYRDHAIIVTKGKINVNWKVTQLKVRVG
jgi:hypothetical protein